MNRIIGTDKTGYNPQRNIYGLPFAHSSFSWKKNWYDIPYITSIKLRGKVNYYYRHSFFDWNLHQVSLFHFFNTISFGSTPWVTTFETSLPRWGEVPPSQVEKGLRLIAGDACKRVIAMSGCAAEIQKRILHDNFPRYAEAIEAKLMVLHPPQRVLVDSMEEKPAPGRRPVFTLVGGDFFRKGGKEVLTAFDQLAEAGYRDWQLNIVSKLGYGDYASRTTREDLESALRIIHKYPDNISHHYTLPNEQVLDLFRQSDVGLLPTYADSYGYSVLEAQAAGCSVITTDIRALPEINDEAMGWVIPLPKNEWGNGKLDTPTERAHFSRLLLEQLVVILQGILEDPGLARRKGKQALAKFARDRHSVTGNARTLEALYDEISPAGRREAFRKVVF